MERREAPPIPKRKFVLIAHEEGTGNYVLADEKARVVLCDEEWLDGHRFQETLVSFRTLTRILMDQGQDYTWRSLAPGEDLVSQKLGEVINTALLLLGYPPKERVYFFSVPKEIVERLDWKPRKP